MKLILPILWMKSMKKKIIKCGKCYKLREMLLQDLFLARNLDIYFQFWNKK